MVQFLRQNGEVRFDCKIRVTAFLFLTIATLLTHNLSLSVGAPAVSAGVQAVLSRHGKRGGRIAGSTKLHNASSLGPADPRLNQHNTSALVFHRVGTAAKVSGRCRHI